MIEKNKELMKEKEELITIIKKMKESIKENIEKCNKENELLKAFAKIVWPLVEEVIDKKPLLLLFLSIIVSPV